MVSFKRLRRDSRVVDEGGVESCGNIRGREGLGCNLRIVNFGNTVQNTDRSELLVTRDVMLHKMLEIMVSYI